LFTRTLMDLALFQFVSAFIAVSIGSYFEWLQKYFFQRDKKRI